jgi:adenylate cyclase
MTEAHPGRVGRRLAAIVAADVAGYSRLMGLDEVGTARTLREHRKVTDALVARHGGRLVKTTGDGVLLEFPSVVDAVECAVAVQAVMAERNEGMSADRRMLFRIGINLGDILIEGDDILGDGVNSAARIENECEPGGAYLSDDAYRQVRGKTSLAFDDLGERSLKNIDRPVRLYAVRSASFSTEAAAETDKSLPLPDKPSIAVLPFQNMSGDPEQEYFADGMVEEIITALSRFKWLFVIARNSSFTFKGKAVDVKEVGRRLGVRYVLEGSVRKAAGKVRITGQLIDAVTGAHIWADKFERDLTDVFALQDEVTVAVVSAVQPKLIETEIEMATRRRPENLTAYDLCLRARQKVSLRSREAVTEMLQLAHQALDLDPRSVWAAVLAAIGHYLNVVFGFSIDPQFDRNEARRLVNLALSLDENDDRALSTAAYFFAFFDGDYETAIDFVNRAVASNPNDPGGWNNRGWVYKYAGHYEEAIVSFERAIRVSPLSPYNHNNLAGIGTTLIELRRFDEAVAVCKKARRQNSSDGGIFRFLAGALAHLGRDTEAREAAARLLEIDPTFTISSWIARGGQANSKLLIEGLRKAGLPE